VDKLEDYSGLVWRRPVLASIFTVMLLSLAGIPATAGFLAKFYVVDAGASTANWALVLILVITSVIGLFYYLRIVVTMFAPVPEEISVPTSLHPGSYVLIALTVLLLWFGIYPGLLLNIIKTALTM